MAQLRKILVVDSEFKAQKLIKSHLKKLGYCVIIGINDGKEALELTRGEKRMDLVILDISIPKINGLEVFDVLKAEFPRLKVIISSVYSKDEQEFFIPEADAYYCKSDCVDALVNKVNKILNK